MADPKEQFPSFAAEVDAIVAAIGEKRLAAFLATQRNVIRTAALCEAADRFDGLTARRKPACCARWPRGTWDDRRQAVQRQQGS